MPIAGLIPLVVAGGIVKKFSDSMLGEPRKPRGYGRSRPASSRPKRRASGGGSGLGGSCGMRATYPSKHCPF